MTEAPTVTVQRVVETATPGDEAFRQWMAIALSAAGAAPDAHCTLRIVDRAESADLNQRYRGSSGPTNVLAFAQRDVVLPGEPQDAAAGVAQVLREAAGGYLGDLVICAPLVAEEAAAQGKPEAWHWAHLAIHGVLHLLGYDHLDVDDREAMEALEIELLAELGIPDPYRPVEATSLVNGSSPGQARLDGDINPRIVGASATAAGGFDD